MMIDKIKGEEKKAFMLLKSLILHYHGLDEDEERILKDSAKELDAHDELKWANAFIAEDYLSAFERSKEYLNKIIGALSAKKKLGYLMAVWEDNNKKGYLTEMEATAMINLAKDWKIEKDLLAKVNH
ncbi:MAG: hypothetical protein RIF33_11900 [Cyclobacteriaceae bacterium]